MTGEVNKILNDGMNALVGLLWECGVEYGESVTEFKKRFVLMVLRRSEWNQCAAAVRLGVHRNTVARLIEELKIELPHERRRNRPPELGRFANSPVQGRSMAAAAGR